MSLYKSDQVTKLDAVPSQALATTESHGRKRVAVFTFTTPSAGLLLAGPDEVDLCEIPAGARLIGGETFFEAMGGGATMEVGDGTTADKYGTGIDVSAAGADVFLDTLALNWGEVLTSKLRLRATVSGANWAGDKKFYGMVEYVLD